MSAVGEREGQSVTVEGVHEPDQLARASGVWIATAGSAMLTAGQYELKPQTAWTLIMCQQGAFQLNLNDLKIKGRECCIIPRQQEDVSLRIEQEARIIWLLFDGPLADGFMVKMGGMTHRAMKQGALPSQLKLARHIVQAAVRIGSVKEASSAQLQQLLWGLLASHSGQAVAMDAVLSHEIAKVIDAMRKNQYRDSFSLNDMASLSRMPVETAPPPMYHWPSPWWTNIRAAVASMSGILHTRIRNMVSWYIISVIRMDTTMAMPSDSPYHRYMLTNTYAEQLASVQADMSKPSGAIVTVAAMPNTVVMDMARRMLIMLFSDMKLRPFTSVKMTKHSSRVMTAAQSSNMRAVVFPCFAVSAVIVVSS